MINFLACSNFGKILTIPTFGHQPVILGGFYTEVENEFLPGIALWSTKTVNKFKTVIEHPVQETTWSNKQTLKDKLEMLSIDISGSITVDIAAGKQLVAKGSFTYLDEESVSTSSILKVTIFLFFCN